MRKPVPYPKTEGKLHWIVYKFYPIWQMQGRPLHSVQYQGLHPRRNNEGHNPSQRVEIFPKLGLLFLTGYSDTYIIFAKRLSFLVWSDIQRIQVKWCLFMITFIHQ